MSGIYIFFILIGIFATILFIAGYVIGIKQSFADSASDDEVTEYEDSNYTISIFLAVLASAGIIFLAGVNPIFIYVGPFLAIVTAAMVGYAFFFERNMRS